MTSFKVCPFATAHWGDWIGGLRAQGLRVWASRFEDWGCRPPKSQAHFPSHEDTGGELEKSPNAASGGKHT